MRRILIFGDSVEYGAWDTKGGWVDRMKQAAHAHTLSTRGKEKIQIINLGIGGNTSRKILERMKNEIDARHTPTWDLTLVFSFGTNDSRLKDGVAEVLIEDFKNNAHSIIELAKSYTDNILIVGNPPLNENIVRFKVFEFFDQRVKQYDEALAEISVAYNMPFISLRSAFVETHAQLFAYDNIHPNDDGHELIRKVVEPYILKENLNTKTA